MRWPDAALPVRMRRIAIVAPAGSLRDVLVAIASAAAVQIDDGNGGQATPGEAARRLRHAGRPAQRSALTLDPPGPREAGAGGPV
jgi:V/A-type H+/Na+-transporting ATPase subunit I